MNWNRIINGNETDTIIFIERVIRAVVRDDRSRKEIMDSINDAYLKEIGGIETNLVNCESMLNKENARSDEELFEIYKKDIDEKIDAQYTVIMGINTLKNRAKTILDKFPTSVDENFNEVCHGIKNILIGFANRDTSSDENEKKKLIEEKYGIPDEFKFFKDNRKRSLEARIVFLKEEMAKQRKNHLDKVSLVNKIFDTINFDC